MSTMRRDRLWSPLLGMGWLNFERGRDMSFEADGGAVLRFKWSVLACGTPDYLRRDEIRAKRAKGASYQSEPMTDEEDMWSTIQTDDGQTLTFRREGPPPESLPLSPTAKALPREVRSKASLRKKHKAPNGGDCRNDAREPLTNGAGEVIGERCKGCGTPFALPGRAGAGA